MFRTYYDFEIQIIAAADSRYTVIVRSRGGDATATMMSPAEDPRYQELYARLAALDTSEEDLVALGTLLFDAIFQGDVKSVYTRSQGELGQDKALRLRLKIEPRDPIAALPWEFIYDPDLGHLALLDAPIVRYIPISVGNTAPLTAKLPLRVLLTGAQTAPPIGVRKELEEVQQALEGLAGQITIDVEPHLTPMKLQRLLRGNYHIWHFVGHGGFDQQTQTAALYLEDQASAGLGDDEPREPAPLNAMKLGVMLNRSSIRLIVLDACEGARLATDPFRSIAPALIRGQIPAVIAMQFKVPDDSAQSFAGEFYRALAEGFPIDACVTEGRKAVLFASSTGSPDWGIPVVYTRAEDGKLFDLPATEAAPTIIPLPTEITPPQPPVIAPTAPQSASAQDEEREQEIARLREILHQTQRRLHPLELQKARYGIDTRPEIVTQIEDLAKEIDNLKKQIAALGGR